MLRAIMFAAGVFASQFALQTAPSTQLADPPTYRCKSVASGPVIDGRAEDPAWQAAEWSPQFVHIVGPETAPLNTRMKMVWDEKYLYVLAELEDPHVWGTMTERNAPLFREGAFEIFIDPNGDRRNYYEFEVSPRGTVMELTMDKPYKEGGKNTDVGIEGMKMAVIVDGTVNDPSDVDRKWTMEVAIPFAGLAKIIDGVGSGPEAGQRWKMNFMRMHYGHRVEEGKYVKEKATGHWVWSRQGVVNMHVPERWGSVVFEK